MKKKRQIPARGERGKKKPRARRKLHKSANNLPTQAQRGVAIVRYIEPPPKPRTRLEIAEAICRRVIDGERYHKACSAEGIAWRTFWGWKAQDPDIAALYARAREGSAESWEDRATETAEGSEDARLKVDTFKWRAKMANPKKFADRPPDALQELERIGLEALLAGAYRKAVGMPSK